MVTVKLNEDTIVKFLMDRVNFWTESEDVRDLFKQMYERYASEGIFEGMDLDIMEIVDNDYINYCHVLYDNDKYFEKILALYDKGNYDISMKDCNGGYSFIEAVSDDRSMILVRS